jgi:DmsE family decaheme c-type cytochrome
MRRRGIVSIAFIALLVAGFVVAAKSFSQPAPTLVGSEACQDCHEAEYTQFKAASHGRAAADSMALGGVALGCETCHGPGSAHVAADGDREDPGFKVIKSFSHMPTEEANAACLGCHQTDEQFHWTSSAHAREDVGCVQCHSVHHPMDAGAQSLLKGANTNEMCLTCHKSKRLGLSRSAHMPLVENGMDCASCHNPHGSPSEHMIRGASNNELCESCHADKRGPMLWEHAPVRENCLTCHEPHGSNNDKVLAGKRPFLCQTCHAGTRHPSTLYDFPDLQSNRLFNRSCTNCHSQIHGSNHPSGQFFLR